MKTQVVIIGAGPAGMLLCEILSQHGIDCVVLEKNSRAHVLERIRAGVLEQGTVDLLRQYGLGQRMDQEGHVHDGMKIVWAGRESFFIDVKKHLNKQFMAYEQTNIQEDLFLAADRRGAKVITEVANLQLMDLSSNHPHVTFTQNGETSRLDCDYIAGCDGFHGVSRQSIPSELRHEFEKEYPFGWLGILSKTPPLQDIVYANHPRGFALASMRSPSLSRYYIQVPMGSDINEWSDDRFWSEIKSRFPKEMADEMVTGPSIEKSIAPLRSYVCETMRHGQLFLAGDAAHIVPPTGAKGLNLAVSDVFYLSRAFSAFYDQGKTQLLDEYSATALRRVWSSVRISWYLTNLLHRFPGGSDFDQRAQEHELDYLKSSYHAQVALAEQYAGLPFEARNALNT